MSINVYARLKELLPEPALMVGVVESTTGGVATIVLPGGGKMQARGGAAVSDRVYFRNGLIEGQAAAQLTIEVIEV